MNRLDGIARGIGSRQRTAHRQRDGIGQRHHCGPCRRGASGFGAESERLRFARPMVSNRQKRRIGGGTRRQERDSVRPDPRVEIVLNFADSRQSGSMEKQIYTYNINMLCNRRNAWKKAIHKFPAQRLYLVQPSPPRGSPPAPGPSAGTHRLTETARASAPCTSGRTGRGFPPSRRRPHASARCGRPSRGGAGRGRAWRTRRRDPVCGWAVGRGRPDLPHGHALPARGRPSPSALRRPAARPPTTRHPTTASCCAARFAGRRRRPYSRARGIPEQRGFSVEVGIAPGVGGKMDSFFAVSRVALCICLLALAAAPEHTENKMDVFPGVVGSIFLLAVFALAFQPGFSGALPATAAIPALRPVSAPVERPPGPRLPLLRRDIARRARPFRARGAVLRKNWILHKMKDL